MTTSDHNCLTEYKVATLKLMFITHLVLLGELRFFSWVKIATCSGQTTAINLGNGAGGLGEFLIDLC